MNGSTKIIAMAQMITVVMAMGASSFLAPNSHTTVEARGGPRTALQDQQISRP
jgi:hypothetical protein